MPLAFPHIKKGELYLFNTTRLGKGGGEAGGEAHTIGNLTELRGELCMSRHTLSDTVDIGKNRQTRGPETVDGQNIAGVAQDSPHRIHAPLAPQLQCWCPPLAPNSMLKCWRPPLAPKSMLRCRCKLVFASCLCHGCRDPTQVSLLSGRPQKK